MKKRIISLGLLLSIAVSNIPIISFATTNKTPTLNAYQLENNAKIEWAIEMDDSDVLYQTGFEIGDELPSLTDNVPANNTQRYHGGQSFINEEKYSGNRSLMIVDTISNSNYQSSDMNGNITYSTSSRAGFSNSMYMPNGTDLSVSFRAKTTGSGKITPNGRGGRADFGTPINIFFEQDVKSGDKTVKVSDITTFKDYVDRGRQYYLANMKGAYTGYIYPIAVDVVNSTITLSGTFRGDFKKGDNLLAHKHRNPVSFESRTVTNTGNWELFNVNTKVLDYSDYNTLLRGFLFGISTQTSDTVYIDDIKFGYATKAELYRDNTKIYEGFLSDYDDKAATDKAKPNKVESTILSLKDGNISLNITRPEDNGTKYSYQVMSVNHQGQKTPSAKKDVIVTTGVKGYSYILDKNPNTVPGTIINETTDTIKVPVNTNEKYYLHVRAIDGAGNASDVTHYEVQDNVAPELTLLATNTNPTNKDVVISASATDSGLGVKEIILPNGTAVQGTNATFTATENGEYSFTAKDYAGNITAKSININNIDKVLPVINIEDYETDWTNKDITVNATADKGTLNKNSHIFTENSLFEFIATDISGNISKMVVEITNIDKVAPTMPSIELDKANHKLLLTEGTDSESGVDKSLYLINNDSWVNFTEEIDISNFSDGDYTITLKTIDKAGNEGIVLLNFKINYQETSDNIDNEIENSIIDESTDLGDLEDLIGNIQEEIDKLPSGYEKDKFQDKLDELQNKLIEERDKRLKEAIKAVELAEATRREPYIQRAIAKVSILEDSHEKTALEDRIKAIEYVDTHAINVKNVDLAVALAEATKRDPYITRAKDKVRGLEVGPSKEALELRLFKLEELLSRNTEITLKNAERLVSTAESTKRASNLLQAKEAITRLKPCNEKTEYLIRLERLAMEIEDLELSEEVIEVIRATHYVEMAELYDYSFILRKAYEVVEKLEDSEHKVALMDRLNNINR